MAESRSADVDRTMVTMELDAPLPARADLLGPISVPGLG